MNYNNKYNCEETILLQQVVENMFLTSTTTIYSLHCSTITYFCPNVMAAESVLHYNVTAWVDTIGFEDIIFLSKTGI